MADRKIGNFVDKHYRHFNAAALRDAAIGYRHLIDNGGKMFLTLAGAMSTAELGISLAEMIRQEKVHAICCTGANLEEDLFLLVAKSKYLRVPHYRYLSEQDDKALFTSRMNRVTDTCIPEEHAVRKIEKYMIEHWEWGASARCGQLWHQYFYELILSKDFQKEIEGDVHDSWLYAAAEVDLPIFVPGFEDSSVGNIFAAAVYSNRMLIDAIATGTHYMINLIDWYKRQTAPVGFFQIGGGIAGDFAICAVPLLNQELSCPTPLWAYFCQISDSTTSYGSYSGATPNEKISWNKLEVDSPKFVIESDATIVAPLIFEYVLGH